jgi:LysR family transcriptional regulator, regulator for genes of the gallate degradation pathway
MTSDGSWPRRATLRQFAIFEAIVRSGSAGGAARLLGLSQPAVSHAIARLERMLGAPLLDRGPEGSGPNEIGTILHRRVARLREQIALGISAVCAGDPLDDIVRQRLAALTSTQATAHLAIAGHGSFRAAARALAISEPALQRTARELERLLGEPLYQRRGQQIVVTRAGGRFAAHLQLGLAEIEQAHDEIEASRGLSAGRIALGCLPLMPKSILARSLGQLLAGFPSVEVSLEEGSYDRLSGELKRGKLDMLLGALRDTEEDAERDADIETRALFDDPYVVIARSGHPLATRPSRDALSRQAWVAPPSGTPRRIALEAFFATLPRRPRIVLETASVAMMMATLAESDCLSLSARSQAETDFAPADLAMLDVRMEDAARHVGVTMRSNWLPTTVQSSFLVLLEEGATPSRLGPP